MAEAAFLVDLEREARRRVSGLLIGTNDLWIAATALVHELPLITRSEGHFRRVPELRVVGYGA